MIANSFSKIIKSNYCSMKEITSITDIMHLYDAFLIDLWGVIHDGKNVFPSAIEAVEKLQKANKKIIFLSNMPRPKSLVIETLTSYGLAHNYEVVTSGDCTDLYLEKFYKNAKIYHFGAAVNSDIAKGFTFTQNLNDADVVLLSMFTENLDQALQYKPLCKEIADKGIPVICANPDKQASHGNDTRYTAGYFANIIEEYSGSVHYIGKPFVSIYDYVFKTYDLNQNQCIMIGDTLETDILGASNSGIDSLLVLSGVTHKQITQMNLKLQSYIFEENLPEPTFIMTVLS